MELTPLDPTQRLKYFADLRPTDTSTYEPPGLGGEIVTIVALGIIEYPQKPDDSGEATPSAYAVVEIDSQGREVDDWYPGSEQDCLDFGQTWGEIHWEPLRLADGEAPEFVRQRLSEPPRRR